MIYIYTKAFNEAYDECRPDGHMTSIVPATLPSEYQLDNICVGNNLIDWIRDRAENDEVFNINTLSDLIPGKKSIPNISVKKAFGKK